MSFLESHLKLWQGSTPLNSISSVCAASATPPLSNVNFHPLRHCFKSALFFSCHSDMVAFLKSWSLHKNKCLLVMQIKASSMLWVELIDTELGIHKHNFSRLQKAISLICKTAPQNHQSWKRPPRSHSCIPLVELCTIPHLSHSMCRGVMEKYHLNSSSTH